MGFKSFLLSRDILGHPLSINYKGQAKFNTLLGAFLSIGIQVLVLIQLIQLTIDMVQMNDPIILSYSRPLYEEEVNDFGQINMSEYRLDFGVYITSSYDRAKPIKIPRGIGRMVNVVTKTGQPIYSAKISPGVNCTDLFSYVNMDLTEKSINAKRGGHCFDPDDMIISGVSTFGDQTFSTIYFLPCFQDDLVTDKGTCYDNKKLEDWRLENEPYVQILTSFSFIDFES